MKVECDHSEINQAYHRPSYNQCQIDAFPLTTPMLFLSNTLEYLQCTPLTMVPVSYNDCQSQQVQANKFVVKRKQTSDAVLARAAAASIRTRQNTFKSFKQSAQQFFSHKIQHDFILSHSFLLIALLVNGTRLQKIYK